MISDSPHKATFPEKKYQATPYYSKIQILMQNSDSNSKLQGFRGLFSGLCEINLTHGNCSASAQASRASSGAGEPLLEQGDRLSREEFERRYERMPQLKKAELIEGTVFMASPLPAEKHARLACALALQLP